MPDIKALLARNVDSYQTWLLENPYLGRQVVLFAQLDSTNNLAIELSAYRSADGIAILADEQRSGRGQQGRIWYAPPKSSVLLSVLMFPPQAITRPVMLTALAAVAVCRLVLRRTGSRPRIKWPNDVLVNGRKICGILIEQVDRGGETAVIVGIGLNVSLTDEEYARVGLPEATSLWACGDALADRDTVAKELLAELDLAYHQLKDNPNQLETNWCHYLGLSHTEVVVETHDGNLPGTLVELRFDGVSLLLPDGLVLHLTPETIRHISLH